jgi:carbonic anhydrase
LLVDIQTGKLDWLVNGYETLGTLGARWNEVVKSAGQTIDALRPLTDFNIGEMKFPETKIGEIVTKTEDWLKQKVQQMETKPSAGPAWPAAPVAPRIPLPPPIRPRVVARKGPKPW